MSAGLRLRLAIQEDTRALYVHFYTFLYLYLGEIVVVKRSPPQILQLFHIR